MEKIRCELCYTDSLYWEHFHVRRPPKWEFKWKLVAVCRECLATIRNPAVKV